MGQGPPAASAPGRDGGGTPTRILVVEDSAGDARLVEELLVEAWGGRVEVRHAATTDAARAVVAGWEPDCGLVDLGLPGCEGLDALVDLLDGAPSVPLVVLTGRDDEETGVAAVARGAQDYLVKGRVDARLLERSIRYAIERHRGDILHRRLAGEGIRRRQALLLNDEIVQRLVVAQYSAENGDTSGLRDAVEQTLAAARAMLSDLMRGPDGDEPRPGDLTRPAISRSGPAAPASAPPPTAPGLTSVLLADDVADLRRIVRMRLERSGRFQVVGEAATGVEAVEMAAASRPDLVLLDLSMPEMDGLEALPLIRERSPRSRVVVLSGFDAATVGHAAMSQGAVACLEKQGGLTGLVDRLLALLDEHPAHLATG